MLITDKINISNKVLNFDNYISKTFRFEIEFLGFKKERLNAV